MNFTETKIGGVYVIDPKRFEDDRGFVAPAFSSREFDARGIDALIAESNISYSLKAGTLRGLHFQAEPHGQAKLVRCTRGRVYDVAVDIRPGSPARTASRPSKTTRRSSTWFRARTRRAPGGASAGTTPRSG